MTPPPAPGRAAPPPGVTLRWLRTHLGTAGAVVTAWFASTVAVAYAYQDTTGRLTAGWWMLLWLAALVPGGLLALRRRRPVLVCVVAAVSALVVPLDAVAALIALPWVVARRPVRTAAWCTALTAAATTAALARDHLRPLEATVLSVSGPPGTAPTAPSLLGYLLIAVLCLAVAIGAGLLRRSFEAERAALGQQQRTAQVAAELRSEMSRQEERELIAREVHDTVARALSLVSLQASALEASRPGDGEVAEAARSIRGSTRTALEEMRDLVGTLRRPGQSNNPLGWDLGGAHSLADLAGLVQSTRQAGVDVRARVFVSDGGAAPPALTRAVYRIVQESMTNALRHAPGAPVEVDVTAAPGGGVELRVANLVPGSAGSVAADGGGAGLLGMRERAERLGGAFDAGVRDGWFVVSARLPWGAEAAVSVPAPTVGV
ncbi:histidine kinase [Actinotalea ferrariae CF5-4]|uniref:histidine kinase n=1 Tax=Actinotalea ferrariae CF5-4 TaxID=948458 RepID=A0A021VR75_9CELL|nr:histidine kinase [Actinotalea ferrariae]EYR63641.1 histidine kinase [Actinotalea ferrariae CF5-4]